VRVTRRVASPAALARACAFVVAERGLALRGAVGDGAGRGFAAGLVAAGCPLDAAAPDGALDVADVFEDGEEDELDEDVDGDDEVEDGEVEDDELEDDELEDDELTEPELRLLEPAVRLSGVAAAGGFNAGVVMGAGSGEGPAE
jgi:hypothetical protein